jgi:hypothetical protein
MPPSAAAGSFAIEIELARTFWLFEFSPMATYSSVFRSGKEASTLACLESPSGRRRVGRIVSEILQRVSVQCSQS